MSETKVALITGGASGMGLAVAQVLAPKGWTVHLLDFNEKAGHSATPSLPNSKFHKVDVTSWESLSKAFQTVFSQNGRLDFVFANAGIVERDNFYETPDSDEIPPEPNQKTTDVNLKAVINQAYLALHYFRRSPHKGKDASLVMTASVGGLVSPRTTLNASASYQGILTRNSTQLNTALSTQPQRRESSTSCAPSHSPITTTTAFECMPYAQEPSKRTYSTMQSG